MLDFSVTFIITIINIAILFFILRAVLFKPVTKFMAERAKRVQDSIDQAERDKTRAKNLLDQYENKLKDVDAEAESVLHTAHEDAEKEAERCIAEGKASAENIIANTRRQLEAERQEVLARFMTDATAIVMAAASRLAARELSGDDNQRYANMLLDELAAQKENRG
jgi:F-type H+-transporting ATPase subunit b